MRITATGPVRLRRRLTNLLAVVTLVAATLAVVGATPASGAGIVDAPDGSRSRLEQQVIDRDPLPGGGWEIVIEATLDSNAVCHTFLLQCVVEPELVPANMTLVSVECLSPAWVPIQITLPVVGTLVDVCARFDGRRAGIDQEFRFTYTTPVDIGTLTETTNFFRFPEEYFFIRASDTITIDLDAEADVSLDCPDSAIVGQDFNCVGRVEAFSTIPTAGVAHTAGAGFVELGMTPDTAPTDWICPGTIGNLSTCAYLASGGSLPPGVYTFTTTTAAARPPGSYPTTLALYTGATLVASGDAEVRVSEAPLARVDVTKVAEGAAPNPGSAVSWLITVANAGPSAATDLTLTDPGSPHLENTTISQVSGPGIWVCTSGAPLTCTTAAMPVGSSTFRVIGTVRADTPVGTAIVNETTLTYANDPDGPDYPVRAGAAVVVQGIAITIVPRFTG